MMRIGNGDENVASHEITMAVPSGLVEMWRHSPVGASR